MKTIILSDVNSKWESVIPYGLRVGRSFESEVDVVYVIDTRLQQGEYTSYSDSQSITPGGNKLSQDEIIKRERSKANLALDNLLSAEASRLNYPLKVNRKVKENSIVDELIQLAEGNPDALFVISAEPDHYIFEAKEDIISVLQDANVPALLVPPRLPFEEFKNVLLPVDFRSEEFDGFRKLKFFFEQFEPVVDAVTVIPPEKYSEFDAAGGAWRKTASEYFIQTTLKTNVLEGGQFTETIADYANRNDKDLLMLVHDSAPKNRLEKQEIVALMNETNLPLLYYFHKK